MSKIIAAVICVGLASLAPSGPATAEVVVTGVRVGTDDRTPATAVAAIDVQNLEDVGAHDVAMLVALAPGYKFPERGAVFTRNTNGAITHACTLLTPNSMRCDIHLSPEATNNTTSVQFTLVLPVAPNPAPVNAVQFAIAGIAIDKTASNNIDVSKLNFHVSPSPQQIERDRKYNWRAVVEDWQLTGPDAEWDGHEWSVALAKDGQPGTHSETLPQYGLKIDLNNNAWSLSVDAASEATSHTVVAEGSPGQIAPAKSEAPAPQISAPAMNGPDNRFFPYLAGGFSLNSGGSLVWENGSLGSFRIKPANGYEFRAGGTFQAHDWTVDVYTQYGYTNDSHGHFSFSGPTFSETGDATDRESQFKIGLLVGKELGPLLDTQGGSSFAFGAQYSHDIARINSVISGANLTSTFITHNQFDFQDGGGGPKLSWSAWTPSSWSNNVYFFGSLDAALAIGSRSVSVNSMMVKRATMALPQFGGGVGMGMNITPQLGIEAGYRFHYDLGTFDKGADVPGSVNRVRSTFTLGLRYQL